MKPSPIQRFLLPVFALLWVLSWNPLFAAPGARAMLTINSNSGTLNNSSTNTSGSFQLKNLSTGGQHITSAKVDLGTALLPDVVFDPAGTAGDVDGKAFEIDSYNGTGTPVASFESPHDGTGSADGYDALKIVFAPATSFGPGDTMTFSADVDPTNVKGVAGPGPSHAASISGLELIGATVTVTFDDGTTRVCRTAGLTGPSNTNKTSMADLGPDMLPTPGLVVPGKVSPFVSSTQLAVRVTGPPGAQGEIWNFKTELYLAGVAGGGYDIDPFEANCVIAYGYEDFTIGAGGFVDIPVVLYDRDESCGINFFAAVLLGPNETRSSSSDILVIDYNPSGGGSDSQAPTAPGALSFSNLKAGSVTLQWAASSDDTGVTGYRIFRDGTAIGTTTGLSGNDSGLTPSTSYAYGVEAYDAAGNVSPRSSISITTPADQDPPGPPENLAAEPGNQSVSLTWTAATDDGGIAGYRVYRNSLLVATVTGLVFTEAGLTNGVSYNYEVVAIDGAGRTSVAAAISVRPEVALLTPVKRVNVGGNQPYVDPAGNTWVADTGFNTGYTESNSLTIGGTTMQPLYQKRRIDRAAEPELFYNFSVPNGNYEVRLHFVEVVSAGFVNGYRIFDVLVEGAMAIDDLDIHARAGPMTALVIPVPAVVSDGNLRIDFKHVVQNPVLSGIEIYEVHQPPPQPTFEEWLVAHSLAGQTAADSDGGGLGNRAEFDLRMDPRNPDDDRTFSLTARTEGALMILRLPDLKPLGDYHLHVADRLDDLSNVESRLLTITRGQIEAMQSAERDGRLIEVPMTAGSKFSRVAFEPSAP